MKLTRTLIAVVALLTLVSTVTQAEENSTHKDDIYKFSISTDGLTKSSGCTSIDCITCDVIEGGVGSVVVTKVTKDSALHRMSQVLGASILKLKVAKVKKVKVNGIATDTVTAKGKVNGTAMYMGWCFFKPDPLKQLMFDIHFSAPADEYKKIKKLWETIYKGFKPEVKKDAKPKKDIYVSSEYGFTCKTKGMHGDVVKAQKIIVFKGTINKGAVQASDVTVTLNRYKISEEDAITEANTAIKVMGLTEDRDSEVG